MQLAVHNLVKRFGPEVSAVNDVSFDVADGEFLVLLGPSGCGKTTTLRAIAGFEEPDAGRIAIGGTPVFDAARGLSVPPERRALGMVFQSYAIWPHMTVFENVAYPLRIRGTGKHATRDRVREVLDLVGLAGLEDRPATRLSGGQMQRVALARSLSYSPRVLLLDEPLSNLDAELRARLRFELKEVQRRVGVTAVYVTHDQAEAAVLGDRVAVMKAGSIVQLGSPEDIYTRPRNRFVAAFTGSTNFFAGRVVRTSGRFACLRTERGLDIAGQPAVELREGGRAVASVHPEYLEIERAAEPGPNQWPATVLSTTFLGTRTSCAIEVGGEQAMATVHAPMSALSAGQSVVVTAAPSAVSIFPEEDS